MRCDLVEIAVGLEKSRSYTIGAICRSLPRASLLLGAGFDLLSWVCRAFNRM